MNPDRILTEHRDNTTWDEAKMNQPTRPGATYSLRNVLAGFTLAAFIV